MKWKITTFLFLFALFWYVLRVYILFKSARTIHKSGAKLRSAWNTVKLKRLLVLKSVGCWHGWAFVLTVILYVTLDLWWLLYVSQLHLNKSQQIFMVFWSKYIPTACQTIEDYNDVRVKKEILRANIIKSIRMQKIKTKLEH